MNWGDIPFIKRKESEASSRKFISFFGINGKVYLVSPCFLSILFPSRNIKEATLRLMFWQESKYTKCTSYFHKTSTQFICTIRCWIHLTFGKLTIQFKYYIATWELIPSGSSSFHSIQVSRNSYSKAIEVLLNLWSE